MQYQQEQQIKNNFNQLVCLLQWETPYQWHHTAERCRPTKHTDTHISQHLPPAHCIPPGFNLFLLNRSILLLQWTRSLSSKPPKKSHDIIEPMSVQRHTNNEPHGGELSHIKIWWCGFAYMYKLGNQSIVLLLLHWHTRRSVAMSTVLFQLRLSQVEAVWQKAVCRPYKVEW